MADEQTMGERMASVEGWIEGHERLCAERYQGIHNAVGELKDGQRSATRAVWGIVIVLLGWLALQVWDGRNKIPTTAVTVNPPVASTPPPAAHTP